MDSPDCKKILIVGGGVGGLTTALCLHQAGFDAEIFEQAVSCANSASASTCCRTPSACWHSSISCRRSTVPVSARASCSIAIASARRSGRNCAAPTPDTMCRSSAFTAASCTAFSIARCSTGWGRPGSIPGAGWSVSTSRRIGRGVLRKPERSASHRGRWRCPGRRRRHPFHGSIDPLSRRGTADLERHNAVARRDGMAGPCSTAGRW